MRRVREGPSDNDLVEACAHKLASAGDYLCLHRPYVLKLVVASGDVIQSASHIGWDGFLKESEMTGVDPDYRR